MPLASPAPELRHTFCSFRNGTVIFYYSNGKWTKRDRNWAFKGGGEKVAMLRTKNVWDKEGQSWRSLHAAAFDGYSVLEMAENEASERCFLDIGELNAEHGDSKKLMPWRQGSKGTLQGGPKSTAHWCSGC